MTSKAALRIEVGEVSAFVSRSGQGEPVVLLHCSGWSHAQWRPLAASLAARHEVYAPDLIGYGATSGWTGRGRFCLAHEAAVVRSLIGGLGRPVHLVGHSYGGAVALHVARTRPDLVSSLVLVEPSAFHLLRERGAVERAALAEITAVARGVQESLASGDYRAGYGRFLDYWSGPGAWAALPEERRLAGAAQLAKVALDFTALLEEPAGIDDMRGMAVPTFLLHGGCTTLPSQSVCRMLHEALPRSSLALVQGAGHMLPATHGDRVNRLIVSHLAAQAASARRSESKPIRLEEETV